MNFDHFLNESNSTDEESHELLNESITTQFNQTLKEKRTAIIIPNKANTTTLSKLTATINELKYPLKFIQNTYINTQDNKQSKEKVIFIECPVDTKLTDFDKSLQKVAQHFKFNYFLVIPKGGRNAFLLGVNDSDIVKRNDKVKVKGSDYSTITANYHSLLKQTTFEFKDVVVLKPLLMVNESINHSIGQAILKQF